MHGLGVFKTADGDEVINAVSWALEDGYRLIDTASIYKNEKGVGEGIRRAGLPRDEVEVDEATVGHGVGAVAVEADGEVERLPGADDPRVGVDEEAVDEADLDPDLEGDVPVGGVVVEPEDDVTLTFGLLLEGDDEVGVGGREGAG